MRIQKIKSRSVLFSITTEAGWDLNIHLIRGNKYNYLLDTGLGSLSVAPILEYIEAHSEGAPKPIVVINTHFHWDHIWGNAVFEKGLIVAHRNCVDEIHQYWDEMLEKNKKYISGEVKKHLPNLIFDEELYFAEDRIRLFYTPGHSRDGISILDEVDGVLNAGDNIGDTMDELIPSLEGDKEIFRQTLLKYQNLDFDTCISGHNGVLSKAVIGEMLSQLENKKEKAQNLSANGFNCSQAVLGTFCEELGLDLKTALKLSTSFGGGMRSGEVCGAVSGALMALGLKYGHHIVGDVETKSKAYALTTDFIHRFKARQGTILCKELLGYDVSDELQHALAKEKGVFDRVCSKAIADAVEILETMLKGE